MSQSFSNPEPANGASFNNGDDPSLYRVQITDISVVNTALSRMNVNGSWYSESPLALATWTTPDRAGVITFGEAGVQYPVLEDDTEYSWYLEIVETGGGGTFTSPTYTFTMGTPSRQVQLSSPVDEDTGITLQPRLEWDVDGAGQHEDDYFFPYLRKDNADFTEDDLLVNFYQGLWRQIISGLVYGATYYWQVQAANEAGDLLDSEVWSFTTLVFAPPAVSVDGNSNPTGLNNMITLKRLVTAANNKVFYET